MKHIQEERSSWNWIERGLKKIPVPYSLSSLFIGIIIYIFYEIFSMVVKDTYAGYNKFTIIISCVLIAVQLFGIKYFLIKIRESFGSLKIHPEKANQFNRPLDQIRQNFTTSKMFYLLVMLTFMPFVLIKIRAFYLDLKPFFYQGDPTLWALLLDIYDISIDYFALYLLAILLWMIFNISWMLNKISSKQYNEAMRIDLLDADRIGGLKSVKELILWFSVYYFLVVALAVLTYLVPKGLLLYESESLIIFWIIGVIFFFLGWYSLRKILRSKIETDVASINEIFEDNRRQLINLLSKREGNEKESQLNSLSNTLDIINKERDRILQYVITPIDARSIILFLSSSFISLFTILETFDKVTKSKAIIFTINSVQPHINGSIYYLHQFFPK